MASNSLVFVNIDWAFIKKGEKIMSPLWLTQAKIPKFEYPNHINWLLAVIKWYQTRKN